MARSPLWTSTLSYDAHTMRVAGALTAMSDGTSRGGRQGTRPGPDLTVSIAGTTLTVTTGNAIVSSAAGEGVYHAEIDTAWTGSINAADGTYTRIDLVYLRVWDQDLDGTGLRKADIVYLAGTPSGSPSAPSIPAGQYGVALATVNVPPSGGGAASVNNAARPYTVAPGGILPVSSTADLAAAGLYVGQARYNTTRGVVEYWTGSAWTAQGDWSAYTPTWSGLSALGAATAAGRWTRIGRTVMAQVSLLWGASSTIGGGNISVSLPVAASASTISAVGDGYIIDAGNPWKAARSIITSGSSTANVFALKNSDISYWPPGSAINSWASGAEIHLSFAYEGT
ncbi:hypothetical protein C7C46_09000 [Streptomyces tateyamensis]|uniref:Uncharacterized protein n=1 Tax=Streptomyces tateyamensis TaxID=565073 RepID=A0A2V4NE81_9ACTN|nr:hypothetical protein [Streptomyces tateyamensis]PYC83459.1 hypothetical protein C7C46_09000 [Streptomyces tateyamensis]